jgi:hypothetical protein
LAVVTLDTVVGNAIGAGYRGGSILEERHPTDFIVAAALLLYWRGLVVQKEVEGSCQIGWVMVLPTGVIVLELVPECTVPLGVCAFEETDCDGFLLGGGNGSGGVLCLSEAGNLGLDLLAYRILVGPFHAECGTIVFQSLNKSLEFF